MSKVNAARKFVVALVGIAVTLGLLDEGLAQDIAGALTALVVYLVPNQG